MHTLPDGQVDSFRADLHCHSTFSDGSLTPEEIVSLASSLGLGALVITDHDTIDGYAAAEAVAKKTGLLLGTGVELSCLHHAFSVHILGYDFLPDHPSLQAYCTKQQERRNRRNLAILEKLCRLQMVVEEKELKKEISPAHVIGRPHIAKVLVDKGYVKSVREAFSLYLGDGKSCYVPGESSSVEEGVAIIHEAKGKAFIAHPHLFLSGTVVRELMEFSFDGIECYYARGSKEKERRWLKFAHERNLLISGGSDFHGDTKPHIPLGCSFVNKEAFLKIFQNTAHS